MNSYRYFLPAAVASLAVRLLAVELSAVELSAVELSAVELSPSVNPAENTAVAQSSARPIGEATVAQSTSPSPGLKERDTIDACFNMAAYDPADTSF